MLLHIRPTPFKWECQDITDLLALLGDEQSWRKYLLSKVKTGAIRWQECRFQWQCYPGSLVIGCTQPLAKQKHKGYRSPTVESPSTTQWMKPGTKGGRRLPLSVSCPLYLPSSLALFSCAAPMLTPRGLVLSPSLSPHFKCNSAGLEPRQSCFGLLV